MAPAEPSGWNDLQKNGLKCKMKGTNSTKKDITDISDPAGTGRNPKSWTPKPKFRRFMAGFCFPKKTTDPLSKPVYKS
jgi:hypothetical protein